MNSDSSTIHLLLWSQSLALVPAWLWWGPHGRWSYNGRTVSGEVTWWLGSQRGTRGKLFYGILFLWEPSHLSQTTLIASKDMLPMTESLSYRPYLIKGPVTLTSPQWGPRFQPTNPWGASHIQTITRAKRIKFKRCFLILKSFPLFLFFGDEMYSLLIK
jgi:hypothetical protein